MNRRELPFNAFFFFSAFNLAYRMTERRLIKQNFILFVDPQQAAPDCPVGHTTEEPLCWRAERL